eukprot:COSAG02_NODE_3026_length_7517_cov_4.200593_5_plen_118_part_00
MRGLRSIALTALLQYAVMLQQSSRSTQELLRRAAVPVPLTARSFIVGVVRKRARGDGPRRRRRRRGRAPAPRRGNAYRIARTEYRMQQEYTTREHPDFGFDAEISDFSDFSNKSAIA